MDAAADIADASLRAMFLEFKDDDGFLTVLGWVQTHYMKTGAKRLARILKSMAKGLQREIGTKGSAIAAPQKAFDGAKDELPIWASRKSHAQQTADNLAKKALATGTKKAAKACLPCAKRTVKSKKSPGKPSRKPVRKGKKG